VQGSIEVVVFPKTFAATAERWRPDAVVLVTGSVSMRNDEPQLVADEVEEFIPSDEEMNRRAFLLRIRFARGKNDSVELAHLSDVVTALNHYPGDDRFELIVRNGRWQATLRPPASSQGVRCCPELTRRLEEILGPHSVDAIVLSAQA
jgi:DNA polymerase-3 subunit alpha